MNILILNGPNLNLTGLREPEKYGQDKMETIIDHLRNSFSECNFIYRQSNVEGELINFLHEFGFTADGIIFNPGGYTHTSVALGDAVAAIQSPVIEVHMSNLFRREDFRHVSYIAPHASGVIIGLGAKVYHVAVEALRKMVV